MATIIRVNVQDLNDAFFKELGGIAAGYNSLKLLLKTILGGKVRLRVA